MISDEKALKGLGVTVMGLGLHGGGTATARFLASRGAEVRVTDLRSPEVLAPSLETLKGYALKYTLGRHEMEDFQSADLVFKNPAVPPASPYLQAAKAVETDISLFLRLNRRPLLAITGSKGKSTTASALHHILKGSFPDAKLGGNITVSPLTFLEKTSAEEWNRRNDPVVLELSSWQLADMAGKGVLRPQVSAITNILKDHQDRYDGMDAYVEDKTRIFQEQRETHFTLCPYDDPYGPEFAAATPAKPLFFSRKPLPAGMSGAWLTETGGGFSCGTQWEELFPPALSLPGAHNRLNCLIAAAAARLFGLAPETIQKALSTFTGIGHRMELVRTWRGIRFYNDSAATIPDALAAALRSFDDPIFLIAGGTDKNLDFTPLEAVLPLPAAIYLLEGTAFEKFEGELTAKNLPFNGPYGSLRKAFDTTVAQALPDVREGRSPVVLLSPGCASFGMFLNEFDRGRQFIQMVEELR